MKGEKRGIIIHSVIKIPFIDFRVQEKQMTAALDSMISMTHPNIVKVSVT